MTALITLAPADRRKSTGRIRPATGRKPGVSPVDFITLTAIALRPVVVTLAILAAAIASSTRAHADPGALGSALDSVGISNDGPISSALGEVGQSICPMLVAPGSSLADGASQVDGRLAPPDAGFLAGLASQAECPAFIASVADGNLPFPVSQAVPIEGLP